MSQEKNVVSKNNRPDRLAFFLLLFGLLFIPLFFIPMSAVPILVAKKFFIIILTGLALLLWFLGRMQTGEIKLAKNPIYLSSLLILLTLLLSALFSGSIFRSLIGLGFEYDTFLSLAVFFILLFLFSYYFDDKEKILNAFITLFISSILSGLYMIFVILLNAVFDFSFLNNFPIFTFSSWYETAVFFGFTALLSLIFIEFLPLPKASIFKKILYLSMFLSLLILSLINFVIAWYVIGFCALFVFVFALSSGEKDPSSGEMAYSRKIFRPSFIFIILALLFVVLSGGQNSTLLGQPRLMDRVLSQVYEVFDISASEVRLTWGAHNEILKSSIRNHFLFGVGPNSFTDAWSQYRPAGINNNRLWANDFNIGVGIIPSLFVAGGVVAILSWVIFFTVFVYSGFKTIFIKREDLLEQILVLLTFGGASFFWLMSFFYVPVSIFALAFIMTGLFVAVVNWKEFPSVNISFFKDPRASFFGLLFILVFVILLIFGGVRFVGKSYSVILYYNAFNLISQNTDLVSAENHLNRAISLTDKQPEYFRLLTELRIAQIASLINRNDLSEDEANQLLSLYYQNANTAIDKAITLNPNDYQNHFLKGLFFASLSSWRVSPEVTYAQALESYQEAQKLNPKNPLIDFRLAELEISNSNLTKAKESLTKALEKKINYTDASVVLSQIYASENDMDKALSFANQAVIYDVNNPGAYVNLGTLRFSSRDYKEAIGAFEKAKILYDFFGINNVNVKYFLGLSYGQDGRREEGLSLLREIEVNNPDHQELKNAISNMERGLPPLSGLNNSNISSPSLVPDEEEASPLELEENN